MSNFNFVVVLVDWAFRFIGIAVVVLCVVGWAQKRIHEANEGKVFQAWYRRNNGE